MMRRWLRNGLRLSVTGAVAEDGLVALEVESRGYLTNGRRYDNEYHTLMRVTGATIRELREYSDTQHVRAVWLAP